MLMARSRRVLGAGVGLVLAAALVTGCGDDGSKRELRSTDAGSLRAALDEVEQRVEGSDCSGAGQQAASFRQRVEGLPARVDSKLREALVSSADRLESLVAEQCAAEPATPSNEPPVGTTSESPLEPPGDEGDQPQDGKKDKPPKKEKGQDETQPPPETGGAGEEVPGVGNEGGGAPPQE